MEWIDETVAIGNWADSRGTKGLMAEGIDLMINAKTLFDDTNGRLNRVPYPDKVRRAAHILVQLSAINVKVLVYCRHGRDRSPFVVMLYISERLGLGHHEAYHIVRQRRPVTVFHWDWVEMVESSPDHD